MTRWNSKANQYVENAKVDAFLADIWKVCQQHGMSLSHEDGHGAFIVQPVDEENRRWLFEAHDETNA